MASLADIVERAARNAKTDKKQTGHNGNAKKLNGTAEPGSEGSGGINTESDSQPVNPSASSEAGAGTGPNGAADVSTTLLDGHGSTSAQASPLLAAINPERKRRGVNGAGGGDSADMHASGTPSQNHSRRTSVDSTGSPIVTRSPHDSPSARTGPPRSFSYNFARSPNLSRQNTRAHDDDIAEEFPDELGDEFNLDGDVGNNTFSSNGKAIPASGSVPGGSPSLPTAVSRLRSEFRGALEYNDPEQREREREAREKREKNRLSKIADSDAWINPRKWLSSEHTTHDSPTNEGEGRTSYFDFLKPGDKGKEKEVANEKPEGVASAETPEGAPLEMPQGLKGHFTRSSSHDQVPSAEKMSAGGRRMERSRSMPQMKRSDSRKASISKGVPKWSRLRSLLPTLAQQNRTEDPDAKRGQMAVQGYVVNITDELITGGLAALMLKLWFERDERSSRRVPILFHRLRVRISDSLHPLSANKAVFRVECEYANGAARWVVYRTLRDFVSLHTHYRLSNAFNHNVDALPEFPRTSECFLYLPVCVLNGGLQQTQGLPYFKFLREKGKENDREVRKQDFAIMQREALENYLIGLVRAVVGDLVAMLHIYSS